MRTWRRGGATGGGDDHRGRSARRCSGSRGVKARVGSGPCHRYGALDTKNWRRAHRRWRSAMGGGSAGVGEERRLWRRLGHREARRRHG
uniref:Uncharacterized protein n=1 Tax=Arundo donax TaxID=35708 RepID=A0A0A9FV62_ARUDO